MHVCMGMIICICTLIVHAQAHVTRMHASYVYVRIYILMRNGILRPSKCLRLLKYG